MTEDMALSERLAIIVAIELNKGNKTKAAEWLGISRRSLRKKLKEYRIP